MTRQIYSRLSVGKGSIGPNILKPGWEIIPPKESEIPYKILWTPIRMVAIS